MDLDHLHHETELDLVRFELELLTSARWLARLTPAELAHYNKLCQRERELLEIEADDGSNRMSSTRV